MKVAAAVSTMSGSFRRAFPEMTIVGSPQAVTADSNFDLLIFTGGEDVNPARYGEASHGSYGINSERDEIEFSIMNRVRVLSPGTKILGVCRGFQLMNVEFGGTLFQDMEEIGRGHPFMHKLSYKYKDHPFIWLDMVNSLHHQALRGLGDSVGPARVIANEPNTGMVEAAVWGENYFGVQFHPEMFSGELHDKFFNVIKEWVRGDVSLFPSTEKLTRKKKVVPPGSIPDFTISNGATLTWSAVEGNTIIVDTNLQTQELEVAQQLEADQQENENFPDDIDFDEGVEIL